MWMVYKHTSPSGKVYIGITSKESLIRRTCRSGQGYKNNKHFWNAIQKYGWENFEHEVLQSDLTREEACRVEIELIKEYKSYDPRFGYNIALGGQGYLMTESQKEEVRKRSSEIWRRDGYREKMISVMKERWRDEEYAKNHSGENAPMYGHHHSEESRRKMARTRKERNIPGPNLGRHLSEETRKKIGDARRGKPGHPWTEEQKEKCRKRMSGSGNPNYGKSNEKAVSASIRKIEKACVQIDGCIVVGVFRNAAEAARQTGVCASNINRACNKVRLKAGGYDWRFVEDVVGDGQNIPLVVNI